MSLATVDLLVIGGGPAGLSAANFFSRVKRPCLIYDSGLYRNATSPAAHTIVGFEGENPAKFRQLVRSQIQESYSPLTQFRNGKIISLVKGNDENGQNAFEAKDDKGNAIIARKVVLATGLKDHLPGIPGLQEQWGRRVIHCIFCHGTETASKPFAYLFTPGNAKMNPMLVEGMLKMWPTLEHKPAYILTHGMDVETSDGRAQAGMDKWLGVLKKRAYIIITSPIETVSEDSTESTLNITFASHPPIAVPSMLVFPERFSASEHSEPLLTEALLSASLSPFGTIAPADPQEEAAPLPPRMGDDPRTAVKGLFWAGNSGSFAGNVTVSVAQGQIAAAVAVDELGAEDLAKVPRRKYAQIIDAMFAYTGNTYDDPIYAHLRTQLGCTTYVSHGY